MAMSPSDLVEKRPAEMHRRRPSAGTHDAEAFIDLLTSPTTYWMSMTKITNPAATYPTVELRCRGQITHSA
jgi:hypothetical protein